MRDAIFSPTAPIIHTRQRLIIPAFSYASSWGGVSQMLTRFGIGNLKPFTVKRPIEQPNESFVAAISWNRAPYVYRYKLMSGIGEVLYFPRLNNQQIGVGAYLEIWSVNGSSLAEASENWELQTSKLVLPTLCYPCQEELEYTTAVEHFTSTLPPAQYCNPFCSPLCAPSTDPDEPVTTYPLYWGSSVDTMLDELGIIGLTFRNDVVYPTGEYAFSSRSPAAYLYFAWPAALTQQPAVGTGFTSSGFAVAMAGTSEGFVESENGWNYALVDVGGISYRLYRTYYPLTLGLSVIIISA